MKDFDNNFYKTLLDNLHDGVYFTDRQRRILYWNKGAERITGFSAAEVIGHRCSDNILSHVDEHGHLLYFSNCPLNCSMLKQQPVETEIFLHHKNGHRVPVIIRVTPIRDRDGTIVGAVETFSENSSKLAVLERLEELQRIAFIDPLTGVGTRRFGEDMLRSRFEECRRYGWTFGLLFVDIDNLKQINDEFGHEVGDQALVMVARTLVANIRPFDFVARWGGDEFMVIAINLTSESAQALAEKLQSLVAASNLPPPAGVRLSISIGVTTPRPSDTLGSLLKRADQLLYGSKQNGRGRVSCDLVSDRK
ncbi:MAG TPA: sensor domain-containing diguanylate cyclase [Acidobacteriota bacterium]|nr:sensor domain-containing diguanylate cyclase [Acidobacteriota bacterium]